MLMRKSTAFRVHVRSVVKRIFHLLLARLAVRRLRGHSFFAMLLAKPAVVADFGAHRGEFFAAVKAEYPVKLGHYPEPCIAETIEGNF